MRRRRSERRERLVYADIIPKLADLIERRAAKVVWVCYPYDEGVSYDMDGERTEWRAIGYCERCGKAVFVKTCEENGDDRWLCLTCGGVYTTREIIVTGIAVMGIKERTECECQ